jgi:hypothetical protein
MGEIPDIFTNGMWSLEKIDGSHNPQKSLPLKNIDRCPSRRVIS